MQLVLEFWVLGIGKDGGYAWLVVGRGKVRGRWARSWKALPAKGGVQMTPWTFLSWPLEFFSNWLSSQEHVPSQPGGGHIQTGEWVPGQGSGAATASLGQAGGCQVYPASLPDSWAGEQGKCREILTVSPGQHLPMVPASREENWQGLGSPPCSRFTPCSHILNHWVLTVSLHSMRQSPVPNEETEAGGSEGLSSRFYFFNFFF